MRADILHRSLCPKTGEKLFEEGAWHAFKFVTTEKRMLFWF